MTLRCLLVILVGLVAARPAVSADAPLPVDQALRRILRPRLELSERLAAAQAVLAHPSEADPETLLRAGLALVEDAPGPAVWLLLEGTRVWWADDSLRAEAAERIDFLLADAPDDARRAALAAAGLLLGRRPDGVEADLTRVWPPTDAVAAALRQECALPRGRPAPEDAASALAALAERLPAARDLDRAASEDPARMRAGLEGLVAAGASATPVLIDEVDAAAERPWPGRLPRALRAVLALGLSSRREATPVLIRALEAPDGWLQAAAATALGDLGDPSAVIALCHKLTYRGEIYRPRDQWDWPGAVGTTVSLADWPTIEYFVIDGAAADALLRLGVSGAVGWILKNQLNPSKANFRVRVLQDGIDALRRALPEAPTAAYNPDAGLPQRRAAWETLVAWWRARRFQADLLRAPIDREDEGFRREARRMAERLRGRSVFELQISQETCAILGPAVTDTLVETLAVTSNRVLRTELARALGVVRDVAAVPALLELLRDDASFVRAVAAGSVGAYVRHDVGAEQALLQLLDDREAAPRVAALSALVAAAPSDAVRTALAVHTPESHARHFGATDRDYGIAWTVANLVQNGPTAWPAIRDGLLSEQRYVRSTWWDLLRRALDWPKHVHDADADPTGDEWEALDEARVLEALSRRRSS